MRPSVLPYRAVLRAVCRPWVMTVIGISLLGAVMEFGLSSIDNSASDPENRGLSFSLASGPQSRPLAERPRLRTPADSFAWPVDGPISSVFDAEHPLGIDVGLAATPSAPIRASARGVVAFAGGSYCCSYGYHVIIDHAEGFSTLYAHLSEIHVSEGDVVEQGHVLGLSGDSGFSTSEHLHFELRYQGEHIDPLPYLYDTRRAQLEQAGLVPEPARQFN